MIEYAIRTFLSSWAAVTALIGTGATPDNPVRLYPVRLPQAPTQVCVVYRRITTSRDRAMGGPTGLTAVRLQFDVIAPEDEGIEAYDKAKDVADAIRKALDGRGPIGMGDIFVQDVQVENERDDYAEELRAYRVTFEVLASFTEP